ncbi:alpha/beta fold hydrolase [Nitrogeniibacter mangrovi]|uniref:Alpha/beta fold hydrolase n=1 Tax=Nitrogeniibacter mangrovi TaxID=2016596 RepID=A0A6C1B652_9RHOO|nr:alpha/beta fold hydrolase [Nitrogeniibacter mangrovi]QID19171.1 alpha/beta fold hydrolase [Nitrogeniibacter mangrovi]
MTALHTDILGTGEPIVFIHGSFATTSTWRKMVDTLARDHQCILFKLPGHGTAPAPDDYDAPTIDTELDRIDAAVRDITDRPVHLVGHSYGGMVALAMALRGTLPVRRLTLFEPVAVWVLDAAGDADMAARVTAFVDRYRQDAAAGVTHACGQVLDFWGAPAASRRCRRRSRTPWRA